jgi:hypothetical protein
VCLLLVPCLLAACSDDHKAAKKPVHTAQTAPTTTVVVNAHTKDGKTADPAEISRVVAKIIDPTAVKRPLGIDGVKTFYRLRLLAMGLTTDEANCTADRLVAAGGPDVGSSTLSDLSKSSVAVDPTALSQCMDPSRLLALSNTAPDFSRVPPQELRQFMIDLGTSGMASVGLSTSEAACVVTTTLAPVTDTNLAQAFEGSIATDQNVPDAVASCLTAARIHELAGG